MKKNIFLNVLRILLCLLFVSLAVFVFFHPKKTQTNILSAILSSSSEDGTLLNLSLKHSGRFRVIFKSDNQLSSDEARDEFMNGVDKSALRDDFALNKNISSLLDEYKIHHSALLSYNTKDELKLQRYKIIKEQSLERLYSPFAFNLLPLEEDPFLLFSDFLNMISNSSTGYKNELDGSYYSVLELNLKDSIALSPNLLQSEMPKFIDLKNKIEDKYENLQIYLSGTPVHTYYASSKSMKEINFICIFSSLFIILICKFYFRSYRLLFPIALSLTLGMTFGYLLTCVFFKSIHILTFVFSSTLIGICVDYSLHYFASQNNIKIIFKSLSMSMLTTVCAFLSLLFSNITLLGQIAVFTSGGLIFVYLFVVLFYPLICNNLKLNQIDFDPFSYLKRIPKNIIAAVFAMLLLLSFAGYFRLNFDNEITNMYKPPKFLQNSEKIAASLQNTSASPVFVLVNGKNIQEILENEEDITQNLKQDDFIALSKFIPSIKAQKDNRELIYALYKNELFNYASFLTQNVREDILKQISDEIKKSDYLKLENLPAQQFKDFFANENTSVILLKGPVNFDIAKKYPNAKMVDLKNDISKKVERCSTSCAKLILPAILLLFTVMSLIYTPKNALKIISPSILAGFFVIGILSLFGHGINLFDILALFLIVGFSLDYSIFRFNSIQDPAVSDSRANWAVLISCATSVFSFFLLAMTSFKLISSLGLILSLGLLSSYIFSFILISEPRNFPQKS